MGILRKSLAVLSLLAMCGLARAADQAPCVLKQLASMDVEIDEDGTVLVPVKIDGHDVWMALQMATGLPVLFPAAVAQLGLKTSRLGGADPDMTANNGKAVKQKVVAGHLLLGLADFTGWSLYVLPSSADGVVTQFRGKPVVGVLTSRFLQAVDVELNLGANKINLFAQTQCKSKPLYWEAQFTTVKLYLDWVGVIKFPMELDGRRIETSFNTGSWYSFINSAVTKEYFGFDEKSEGIEQETNASGREISSYRAMALSAKGLAVNHARIRLFKGNKKCDLTRDFRMSTPRAQSSSDNQVIGYANCANATPFSIGTDLLRKLRIYIASKEETIYFTRVDPAAQSLTPAASDPSAAAPAAAPN